MIKKLLIKLLRALTKQPESTAIPKKQCFLRGPKSKYTFTSLKSGETVFVGTPMRTIGPSISHHAKRYGKKFSSRSVEENGVAGVRIWRIS